MKILLSSIILYLTLITGYAHAAATTKQNSFWIHNLTLGAEPQGSLTFPVQRDAKVAVSGQYVHVVWLASSNNVLYYMRSTDGGKTFGSAKQIAVTGAGDFYPVEFPGSFNSFVADGAYLHIFYTVGWPSKLMYLRSTDNGATFKTPVQFASGYNSYSGVYAAAEAGKIAVAWSSNNDNSPYPKGIYCSYSSDNGATYKKSTVSYCDSGSASCVYRYNVVDTVRSGDNVYILATSQMENYFASEVSLHLHSSVDGCATFKPAKQVAVKAVNDKYQASTVQDANYSPNLAAYGSQVNIVWMNDDNPGGFDGYHEYTLRTRRSADAGTTLGPPITLHTYPAGYSQGGYPGQETIVRDANRVFVVTNKGDAPSGTFLWRSTDGGANWTVEEQISTGGWWPQIRLDLPNVHIINGSYFKSENYGVNFDGGVNPHFSYSDARYHHMAVGPDGAVHYVWTLISQGTTHPNDWVLYRRLEPAAAPGATNKALHLENVDAERSDNMQVPAGPDINFTNAMTVEFWVKRISGDYPLYEKLLTKTRTGGYASYMVGGWNNYEIYSRLTTENTDNYWGAWLGTGIALPLGEWTHIAMTYNAVGGADNWRIYVNGVLEGKATLTGRIITELEDSPLYLLKPVSGYPGEVAFDNLRLWNRALSQTEVKQYMSGAVGNESGLRAYYNFNGTAKDITGRGNDGLLMYKETYVSGQPAPAAPSGLTANPTAADRIMLTWNDNSGNENGFEIDRAAGNCTAPAWTTIARVAPDSVTYVNTGLAANSTYAYRVRAYNSQDSASSNCISAKTYAAGTPAVPTGLKAVSANPGTVDLSWQDNSGNETKFQIYQKAGSAAWQLLDTTAANIKKYSDVTATGNTSTTVFQYYLKACNGSVCSTPTSTAVVPFKPGALNGSVISPTQVNLTWTGANITNETGFEVQRSDTDCATATNATWKVIGTKAANTVSYSDTTTASAHTYAYRVRAFAESSSAPYATGYSGFSACIKVTTP